MPPKGPPTEYLTIFLVKEGLSKPSEIFKRPMTLEHPVKVPLGPRREGKLYIQASQTREPRWARIFRGEVDLTGMNYKVASSGAVLLMESGQRLLALTFGHGRHLLKTEALEENFGFHAALNSIDRNRVRAIDKKRFDGLARHTREQASYDVSLGQFGLDADQDLVRSVTGHPRDAAAPLGKRMSGRDSFSVAVPTNLQNLADMVDEYLKWGLDPSYRKDYPEVGNLIEIDRKDQRERLNIELIEKLKKEDLSRTWLVIPEPINWSDAGSFRYSSSLKVKEHEDVHFKSYFEYIGGAAQVTIQKLKRHHVFGFTVADEQTNSWSVFNCIYAELDTADGTFFLDNGTWYKIDAGLVATVNHDIETIPVSSFPFADYGVREAEEDYIKRLVGSDPSQMAVMDQKMIYYGGGKSQVEFCDIFSGPQKKIIHIKRYSGSTVLSHLFAQGIVSAQAFLWDEEFRRKVVDELDPVHRFSYKPRPQADDFEIIYAIAMRTKGEMVLPFFSRITLRQAKQQLSNLNFKVSVAKIQI
jgi:uncharacterized protein (TIGR04141 family)